MTAKTLRRVFRRPSARLILAAAVAFIFAGRGSMGPFVQAQTNPIVLENAQAGALERVGRHAARAIRRFRDSPPTSASTRARRSSFKVKTDSTNYRIDIYRLGYYGGAGARKAGDACAVGAAAADAAGVPRSTAPPA